MPDVFVLDNPMGNADELALREMECWEHWFSLNENEKILMKKTVESELERLRDTVDNWLPAAMRARTASGSGVEIRLVIYPEDLTHIRAALNDSEKKTLDQMADSLLRILEETEN